MNSILTELIQHLKSIGAKNLNEYSKKHIVSIWLLLRGDGRGTGIGGRAIARQTFDRKLDKGIRDYEPVEYLLVLPPLAVFKVQHAAMHSQAFPLGSPTPISAADVAEIAFIDGLMDCRGNKSNVMALASMDRGTAPVDPGMGTHRSGVAAMDGHGLGQVAAAVHGVHVQTIRDDAPEPGHWLTVHGTSASWTPHAFTQ